MMVLNDGKLAAAIASTQNVSILMINLWWNLAFMFCWLRSAVQLNKGARKSAFYLANKTETTRHVGISIIYHRPSRRKGQF